MKRVQKKMKNRLIELAVTRRRVLRFAGLLGGGLLVGGGCREADETKLAETPQSGRADLPLQRAIRRHFSYLSFDDRVIEAFARDLGRHQGPWNPETSPRPYTRFLASTNFFQNGADEAKPLEYVSYYDPYVTSCYNPFASSS